MAGPEGITGGQAPLNQRQREAVAYDRGPLVVLAGPGTGKTRVITHRIARIIGDGVPPESVVALTFTVKAAEEMRVRLRSLIGGAAADRVNAQTFHGFGQRLLRRFPDMVGVPHDFLLIDHAQRVRIARRVARERGVFDGALAEGLDPLVREGLEHIAAFQNLGKFPDECDAFATAWAARLVRAEPDPENARTAAEAGRALQARFARFVRLYAGFAEECRRSGQLCYEDLILLIVKLLRERPEAAAICRADYRHFVVDEFQDVNAGQIALLRELCPPQVAGSRRAPDLCVVGDDDQSIYLFRGADDRAIDTFARVWTGSHTVALEENYRSERCILEVASSVIGKAGHRFAPGKVVRPCEETSARGAAAGACVECVETPDEQSFGETIAAMIMTDRAASPDRPWASYAVIGRTYTDLDRIAAAFSVADIPFRLSRAPSALDDRGVQDVLNWIETLVDPRAAWAAHSVLTRPPLSLPPEQVQAWMLEYGAERSRHDAGEEGRAEPGPFCDWLAARHPEDVGVQRFLALMAELQGPAVRQTADHAILEIIRATGVAHADLPPADERRQRAQHLADLLRFARERTRLLDPPAGLREFWSYFQDLDGSQEPFRGEDEDRVEGPREAADEDQNVVSVLTAHKAKGLEFDTVFVPRVSPSHGYPSTGKGGGLELPEGFENREGDARDAAARSLDEERRLFYVACTRAQRRLVLLAKGTKSRSSSTHFFQELVLDNPGLVVRRTAAEVIDAAERAGVAPSAGDVPGARPRSGRAGVLDRAQREARLLAARALDRVERTGAGPPHLDAAVGVFRDAAATLGVAAHLRGAGGAPEWAKDCPEAARAARVLLSRLAGEPEGSGSITRPMAPPLRLSYSAIDAYERCPKCFYLERVLGFPSDERPETTIGIVAHQTLHAFFERVRQAEAEGQERPRDAELVELAKRVYFQQLAPGEQADANRLAQLCAMLELTMGRLNRSTDEIAELELAVKFEYEHEGVAHKFTAKFDRIDRLELGHRIIDYKTGHATDRLLDPKPEDLQLGVYALALRHYQGVELTDRTTPARGVAEYWHLPTGQAGRIDLEKIAYDKVRKRIGKAIDGMLAGRFGRKTGCEGLCSFVDPDGEDGGGA